jgi:diguanylate cyclase (GGDEF)-like protein
MLKNHLRLLPSVITDTDEGDAFGFWLSDSRAADLLALGFDIFVGPRDVIASAGQPFAGIYVVKSGSLFSGIGVLDVHVFGVGDIIGEGSLNGDEPSQISVMGMPEGAVVRHVPKDDARAFLAEQPAVVGAIYGEALRHSVRRFKEATKASVAIDAVRSVLDDRLMHFKTEVETISASNAELARELAVQKSTEQEIRALALFVSDSPMPVMRVTDQGTVIYANHPALEIMDLLRMTVNGKIDESLSPTVDMAFATGVTQTVDLDLGVTIYVFTMVPIKDSLCVNLYARDVTEERKASLNLRYLADHDALTGMLNRKYFSERLTNELSKENPRCAVFFLDLDRFKEVNDTLGHSAGDQLLRTVPRRLRTTMRAADVIARFGGDEFAVLMVGDLTEDALERHAQKIVDAIGEPFEVMGNKVSVGVSIGMILIDKAGMTSDDVLKYADLAMYKAKGSGRNSYRLFREEYDLELRRRIEIETDMPKGLVNGEFSLNYQPKIDLPTRKLIGAEALLRWTHPKYGPIGPHEFIPAAEQSGFIVELGEWVIRTATDALVRWQNEGRELLPIAVNLSPLQLKKVGFLDTVKEIWTASGLSPSLLEFEITESVVMQDVERSLAVMETLTSYGFEFSIDDFGTGYSSLSYLLKFPIKKIKIDKSFVNDMAHDPNASALASAIVTLGSALGLAVLAEGVETEAQYESLMAIQCSQGQGYLFSRPISDAAYQEMLKLS